MPNHYTNLIICYQQYDEELDDLKELDPLKGFNLIREVMPCPDDLNRVVSSSEPYRIRNVETGHFIKEPDSFIFNSDEKYERIPLTEDDKAELVSQHGYHEWYQWRIDNWGTKWGGYNTDFHRLGGDSSPVLIEFQTAWNAPKENIRRLIETYLEVNFDLDGFFWVGCDPANESIRDIK